MQRGELLVLGGIGQRVFAEVQPQEGSKSLLAFGVGPRGCAGAGFAVDEMTLALAELTRCFRLEVTEPLTLRAGITLRTKGPVFARVSSLGAP